MHYAVACLNMNDSSEAHRFAASGVWRSCGCCGCTEGQNRTAQGHQGQCDDVPNGRQDCDPAVGIRRKPLLCRQERSVSFLNLSVSIPSLSVSVPYLSASIPNLSSPFHLLLLLDSLPLAPTPGSKDPFSVTKHADKQIFVANIFGV